VAFAAVVLLGALSAGFIVASLWQLWQAQLTEIYHTCVLAQHVVAVEEAIARHLQVPAPAAALPECRKP
jgi:hypothetical protein